MLTVFLWGNNLQLKKVINHNIFKITIVCCDLSIVDLLSFMPLSSPNENTAVIIRHVPTEYWLFNVVSHVMSCPPYGLHCSKLGLFSGCVLQSASLTLNFCFNIMETSVWEHSWLFTTTNNSFSLSLTEV